MPWNLEASAGIPGSSVLWRGEWSPVLSYNPKDAVNASDGSSYISKTNNTGKDPTISPLDWDIAAKVGDRGTNAWTLTAADFETPLVGASAYVTVEDPDWVTIGQMIVIETAGGDELVAYSYRVRDKVGNVLTIENIGTTAKAVPYEALGDMTKAIYDTDNDGLVDHAELSDAAPWSGITGRPSSFAPSAHAPTHNLGGSDAIAPDWTQVANKPALQPQDPDLTAIAALAPPDNDIIQRKSGAWTNRTPAQFKTDLSLTKSDVGLSNVDNTADTAKPVSTAQQAALDAKQDTSAKNVANGYAGLDASNKLTASQIPASAIYPAFVTLTDGATITWTVNAAQVTQNATVTLGGARSLAFSGIAAGMNGTLICKQDGTGNRTLALPSGSKVINGGAGSIGLSAAANSIDLLTWIYDGANYFWTFGKAYT